MVSASSNDHNIVNIDDFKEGCYRFVLVPVWVDWEKQSDGTILKKQVAAIGLKDLKRDVHIVHGLTSFVLGLDSRWRTKKYNTQRKHVNNIIQFLNYLILNKRKLMINKLSDLTIQIGTNFLSQLRVKTIEVKTKNGVELKETTIDRGTILDIGRTLTYFYVWLKKKDLLPHVETVTLAEHKNVNQHNGETYHASIFNPILPPKKTRKLEHSFPIKYIPLFFEIAILKAHPIVLGIYLQLFGGLRVSEVVNVRRTQFVRTVNKGDFLLNIQSRNMRTDLKNTTGGGYAKKQRHQLIMQIKDWGDILYRQHLDIYKESKNIPGYELQGALFVNAEGKAMSEPSYRYYFNKLKTEFCDFLIKYGNSEDKLVANHLRIIDWNTHIGRGTFTNMIAEETDNIADLAFLRGDSDLMACLAYLTKTARARDRVQKRISETHEKYVPSLIKE